MQNRHNMQFNTLNTHTVNIKIINKIELIKLQARALERGGLRCNRNNATRLLREGSNCWTHARKCI